jgi:hypothetical protein
MTGTTAIDWPAVEAIGARLGVHSRRLIANRDTHALQEWADRMIHEHPDAATATYRELAVLVTPRAGR